MEGIVSQEQLQELIGKIKDDSILMPQVKRQKGVEIVNGFVNQMKTLENQTRQIESQVLKLDGIISILTELRDIEEEKEEEVEEEIKE